MVSPKISRDCQSYFGVPGYSDIGVVGGGGEGRGDCLSSVREGIPRISIIQ